jgi:hypothetical protein
MKRGPEPVKGYDAAIPAALRRGRLMRFQSSPEYAGNFMFYGNGLLVLVCLRLAVRLSRATLVEISADYAGAIAGLCTIPCGGPVSRELWLYTRHGRLRFFRVGENGGLEEIDREGVPFVDGKPVITMPQTSGGAGSPAPAPAAGLPADSGGVDPPDHIRRWLAKRNAMKVQAAEGDRATGSPKEVPVVEAPAGKTGSSQVPGEEGRGAGG